MKVDFYMLSPEVGAISNKAKDYLKFLPKALLRVGCPPLSLKLVVVLLFLSVKGMGKTMEVIVRED